MKNIVLILVTCTLLAGCGTVASSLQYTQGTKCLESGDYQSAITCLNESVRLDPDMKRTHTNLSVAYLKTGDVENAWYHARQGTLAKYGNESETRNALINLRSHWSLFKKEYQFGKGTSKEDIVSILGEPDDFQENKNKSGLSYGTLSLLFEDDKLVSDKIVE